MTAFTIFVAIIALMGQAISAMPHIIGDVTSVTGTSNPTFHTGIAPNNTLGLSSNTPNFEHNWAQFCDDTACSTNCGTWVDITNSGCLAESGRGSWYMKNSGDVSVGLVYSPADSCNCQTSCDAITSDGCHILNSTLTGTTHSFRFIDAGNDKWMCEAPNNC